MTTKKSPICTYLIAGGIVLLLFVATYFLFLRKQSVDLDLPTYEAPRATGTITIDGNVNDDAWKKVPWTRDFPYSDGSGFPDKSARAKITWDDQYLYFAFQAEDDDLVSTYAVRDDPIYQEDVVEVFLDPEGDKLNYYEFEVSPRNVIFDALFPSYRKDLSLSKKWNAAMRTGVQCEGTIDNHGDKDTGWSVEMAIPFADIQFSPRKPPKTGDVWRMNLFRINITARGQSDYCAWSPPIQGDFHILDRFGFLRFDD